MKIVGGDGQDGLRARQTVSRRIGIGLDVKRGEGQKAQAEKSPKGDQHEGTAHQTIGPTGAYVSALSPSG
jgi:hypothetical protein